MTELRPTRPLSLVYEGAAESVSMRTFMPRFPSTLPYTQVGESRWRIDLDVPHDVRIEYLLEVGSHGVVRTMRDPASPHVATNPFGGNSVFVGPQWRRIDWMRREVEGGRLREVRVTSKYFGVRRHHVLYTPPQLGANDRAPLLVVHDGSDYVYHAGLLRCVDSLIAQRKIEPVRIVGLNPRVRHEHYIGDPGHAAHVVEEVLPHVRRRVPHDGRTYVMGASLGAVASWHLAWSHPDVFAGAFLQSGTFAFGTHPELSDEVHRVISRFVSAAMRDVRIEGLKVIQTCGRFESLIDWNDRVAARLGATVPDHRYIATWSGHDWGAWSGTLVDGLVHMLGEDAR